MASSTPSFNIPAFSPLTKLPKKPSFISVLSVSRDIGIDSEYEMDQDLSWESPDYNRAMYTDPKTNQNYYLIPKTSDPSTRQYGGTSFPIFQAVASHAYQGTPLFIRDESKEYTLQYIGFKINDYTLLSHLSVQLGIDYMGGVEKENNVSLFSALFGAKEACACGPGLYLREVGSSDLTFVEDSGDTVWYALKTPIALYNLAKSYCDDPTNEYCSVAIKDLAEGNLRMHIFYVPNDKEGVLQLQLTDVIVEDSSGNLVEPGSWNNYSNYYKAYFTK
jgi:hypothetical protein